MIFLLAASPAFAQKEKSSVSEQVNRVTMFNEVTDYFATMGKSDVQKAAIKKDRQEKRRLQRLKDLQEKKQEDVVRRQKAIQDKNKNVHGWRKGSYE